MSSGAQTIVELPRLLLVLDAWLLFGGGERIFANPDLCCPADGERVGTLATRISSTSGGLVVGWTVVVGGLIKESGDLPRFLWGNSSVIRERSLIGSEEVSAASAVLPTEFVVNGGRVTGPGISVGTTIPPESVGKIGVACKKEVNTMGQDLMLFSHMCCDKWGFGFALAKQYV